MREGRYASGQFDAEIGRYVIANFKAKGVNWPDRNIGDRTLCTGRTERSRRYGQVIEETAARRLCIGLRESPERANMDPKERCRRWRRFLRRRVQICGLGTRNGKGCDQRRGPNFDYTGHELSLHARSYRS